MAVTKNENLSERRSCLSMQGKPPISLPKTNAGKVRKGAVSGLSFIALFVIAGSLCAVSAATEALNGQLVMIYPGNGTTQWPGSPGAWGSANDNNNPSYQHTVKLCWDDPTFTDNCSTVTTNQASGPTSTCTSSCDGYNYLIPTGTVPGGTVNPRDGKTHMLYAKVISVLNPGPGDVILEGSPRPFTWDIANGEQTALFPPALETSPARLQPSQFGVLINTSDPYSMGTSAGTRVCPGISPAIYDNGAAGYWISKHGVPCSTNNIQFVTTAVTGTITSANFASKISPAISAFPNTIQAIAIAWVEPSAVQGSGTNSPTGQMDNSISSAVAFNGMTTGAPGCGNASVGYSIGVPGSLASPRNNPYFATASKAPYTDYKMRPAMMLVGMTCSGCTSTNQDSSTWAADFPTFKGIVDAAIAATNSNPTTGNVYYVLTSDVLRDQMAVQVPNISIGTDALAPNVTSSIIGDIGKIGSIQNPGSYNVSQPNILMYVEARAGWGYNAGTSWIPGAGIAETATSTSGYMPFGSQPPLGSWLSVAQGGGAVAAYGNAVEPCSMWQEKDADPAITIPNYAQGQTVIEAMWKGVQWPYQGNFAGDPLAAPFSLGGGSKAPPEVNVPNVVNSTQAVATSAITGAGLIVGAISQAPSSAVPSGEVISESPAAGTAVPAGSAVNLAISTGPANVTVPNVAGDTLSAASSALTAAALVTGTVTNVPSSTVPNGEVISESPAAGTSVATDSAVNLVVSTGNGVTTGQTSIIDGQVGAYSGTTPTYADRPDNGGAVGPTQVVQLTGQAFSVWSKTTLALAESKPTNAWFQAQGAAMTFCFDPRVYYDPFISRFVAMCTDGTVTGSDRKDYFCVSSDSDATHPFKCSTVPDSGQGDDTMRAGFDKNGFILCRDGSTSSTYWSCYAFSNAALEWSGSQPLGTYAGSTTTAPWEAFPAIDLNPNKSATAPNVIATRGLPVQTATNAALNVEYQTIVWSSGQPSFSATKTLVSPGYLYNSPVPGVQPGGTYQTDAAHSLSGPVWDSNGHVWAVVSSGPCAANCGKSPVGKHMGFFWFEFDPVGAAIINSGYYFDANHDATFGTVAIDAGNNAHIGVELSSSSEYLSMASFRIDSGTNTLIGPNVVAFGSATYPGGCNAAPVGTQVSYNTAVTDPYDLNSFYYFGEVGWYATPCKWATAIVNVGN